MVQSDNRVFLCMKRKKRGITRMINVEYLKEELKINGYKNTEIAKATGVTPSMITKILNGSKSPGLELSIKLIKTLNLDSRKFLNLDS